MRALVPDMHAALGQLTRLPALSADGMRLKAQVALRRLDVSPDGEPNSYEDLLTQSLAQDLLALAGGAA